MSLSVYNISSTHSFGDTLARGVIERFGSDPLMLSRVQILLPTRRACRSLRDAFLRLMDGKPMLLPSMQPIGDVEEGLDAGGVGEGAWSHLPAGMPLMRRQLLLTYLILARNSGETLAQAARAADDLARLQDQVDAAGISFDGLRNLVPDDYAEHWQTTLRFLEVLTTVWPDVLKEQGCVDSGKRRNLILEHRAQQWATTPPANPVIAAGSTGSLPATAALLRVIAGLPNGFVVLPGLDVDMDQCLRDRLDQTHPQFILNSLLAQMNVDPALVREWSVDTVRNEYVPPSRMQIISQAMNPIEKVSDWHLQAQHADGLGDVCLLDCTSPQEEAGAIALAMREVLEVPGKTAALVTPDRGLARRVIASLARWGIRVDDSAGEPLSLTPVGCLLRLLVQAAAADWSPALLLSLLKHPLVSATHTMHGARLETRFLRGPTPASGLVGMRTVVLGTLQGGDPLGTWFDWFAEIVQPIDVLMRQDVVSLRDLLAALTEVAESLATTDDVSGVDRIWVGHDGEAAALLISDLLESAELFGAMAPQEFPDFLSALMSAISVYPETNSHPRLSILGTLEARLQRADLMILGGLNEGTWPGEPAADPWMSRPMRSKFGLPSPERSVGQSAHDFVQCASAPSVLFTRASRVDGAPTVRSRWLSRLETFLGGSTPLKRRTDLIGWHYALDQGSQPVAPIAPPAPTPPVSARPRKLSVTEIETWMSDPYAIYAKHVLGLRPLEPLEKEPGAATYGVVIHYALERFLKNYPTAFKANALNELLSVGREAFAEKLPHPEIVAFWWPRFERVASWFLTKESTRSAGVMSHVECAGELTVSAPGGDFVLRARADRIDVGPTGAFIIDYKTGSIPPWSKVASGAAPQLPLEAAILAAGGFASIGPVPVIGLEYWRLRGGSPAGETSSSNSIPRDMAQAALDGFTALVAKFDMPETAYLACPMPERGRDWNDYAHLERLAEWSN